MIIKRLSRRISWLMCYFLSIPIVFLLLLLFPVIKIRFIRLFSDRIGHFAMNTELLLLKLEESNQEKTVNLFYLADAPICNRQLYLMWKRKITILPFPRLISQINSLMLLVRGEKYKSNEIQRLEKTKGYQDTERLLKKYPSILTFLPDEIKKGNSLLNKIGIPQGEKYICLLVRDQAYLNSIMPSMNWSYQTYRNADIETYKKAALYLADKGYYVIRMGSHVEKKFDISHPHIIDYANHSIRSDFLDVYLSANCYFFISTSSGLDAVAQIFRRPVFLTNLAPYAGQLQYWYPCELLLTKKLINKKTNQYLSFREIYKIFEKNSQDQQMVFNRYHLSLVNNTDDEILSATDEMINIMENDGFPSNSKTEWQKKFKLCVPFSMVMDNNVLLSDPEKLYIKISESFLERNNGLLD